jgi:hypothetical protein
MVRSGSAGGAKTSYCPSRRSYATLWRSKGIFICYPLLRAVLWNSFTGIKCGSPSLDEDLMLFDDQPTQLQLGGRGRGKDELLPLPLPPSWSGPSSLRLPSTSGSLPPASSIPMLKRNLGTTQGPFITISFRGWCVVRPGAGLGLAQSSRRLRCG